MTEYIVNTLVFFFRYAVSSKPGQWHQTDQYRVSIQSGLELDKTAGWRHICGAGGKGQAVKTYISKTSLTVSKTSLLVFYHKEDL